MCLCLGCFAPSEEFAFYLSSYSQRTAQSNQGKEVAEFAAYAVKRLDRISQSNPRKSPPLPSEIQAVEVM